MSDRGRRDERGTRGVAVVGARPQPGHDDVDDADFDDADVDLEAPAGSSGRRQGRPGGTRPVHVVAGVGRLFRRRRGRAATMGARRSDGPAWLVPVMMVVTAVALFLALLFGLAWGNLNSQNQAQSDVKNVARQFLVAYTNFTPKNLDAKFQTLQGLATGNFVNQADQIFGSSIRQALKQAQVSSEGEVRYLYLQSIQGTQASVYAWVDQTAVNNKVPKPFTDTLQMQLTLVETSQGWKMSGARVLNSPTLSFPTGNSGSTPTTTAPTGH
ncbi:MAG: hypothetical protein KGJ77_02290 [Acidobacteriota bacterium]|nr:hypothetical protein [Acidobacteriota bacterium]